MSQISRLKGLQIKTTTHTSLGVEDYATTVEGMSGNQTVKGQVKMRPNSSILSQKLDVGPRNQKESIMSVDPS